MRLLLPATNRILPCLVAAVSVVASAAQAQTQPEAPAGETIGGDAGVLVGMPAALGTGQTVGLNVGLGTGDGVGGHWLGWGLRASWSQAAEDSLGWAVTHNEIRLRMAGLLQGAAGRGTVFLRAAAGVTAVYESRLRHQANRLGDSASAAPTSAWAVLPGGELELGVRLRIAGDWGVAVSGGPGAHWVRGDVVPGWVGSMAVAWWP